jgi:microcystin-dependent protein
MAQPYIGEIRMFAGNFAPAGWMFCDGSVLAITDNETLFNLIGTTYGGDGQQTFALPDLRGRFPIHMGQGAGLQNYILAQSGGVEDVTIATSTLPNHTHPAQCSSGGQTQSADPTGGVSAPSDATQYATSAAGGFMAAAGSPILSTITGGSQPHDNMTPFLVVDYIISLFGIFPSPT